MMKEKEMKRVPKLRFPEFTDDWEQRKVTELLKNSSSAIKIGPFGSALKKEYFVEEGVKVYAQENVFTGDFSIGSYYITEDKYKELQSCELYPGDLVISMMGTIGACAIFPENVEKGIMNSHLLRLQFDNEVVPKYIMYLLRDSDLIRKQIDRLSVGSIMSGLSSSVVKKLVFPIPRLAEQKKIIEYLDSLDKIITLHQRKLEKLKELRKGVMKKLFSQEVRFKADDGSEFPDWEEKKLGDDVQFINGRAYKQDELLNSGKYLVLRVGNLFTNDSYYYSDLELDNDKYIENGDLIYAWSATFGPRIYYGEKCIYHYHIWKLKFDENIISKIFLNYYLLYDVEKIKSQRTGGTMVHITKNAMEHRELQFPCLAEQQKIADCLSTLDDVIEKQKATLAAWEELKKGLLQQMFV